MSSTIIIGLHPEYNYPGNYQKWAENNTKYASNYGACLISKSIAKITGGEFISDFSDISALRNKYDQCILALATHITSKRDLSYYTEIIKKLDMPTYAFSLGIQDYVKDISELKNIHPSVTELLTEVSKRSKNIGVRGHYTAALLYKNGFKNVYPIGCPTLFMQGNENLQVEKGGNFNKSLVVFHRTIAPHIQKFISEITLLGQDFLDESVFTSNFPDDTKIREIEMKHYRNQENHAVTLESIKNKGIFPQSFEEWFNIIGKQDFVFGPRLHGCISAIIQSVPALMIARDLRVKEISEFFNIPYLSRVELQGQSLKELYNKADFSLFNSQYKNRYQNFVSFLNDNKVRHNLKVSNPSTNMQYSASDIVSASSIMYSELADLTSQINEIKQDLRNHKKAISSSWPFRFANKIRKK